jgi:hypothetical protein
MADSPYKFTPSPNPFRQRRAAARAFLPGMIRGIARDAALSDFEEEGRKALEESRAERAARNAPQVGRLPRGTARPSLSPEEREEESAPLRPEEIEKLGRNYKKGGAVKAKAPVKKYQTGGQVNPLPLKGAPAPSPRAAQAQQIRDQNMRIQQESRARNQKVQQDMARMQQESRLRNQQVRQPAKPTMVKPGQVGSATGTKPNIGGVAGSIFKKGGKVAAKAKGRKR